MVTRRDGFLDEKTYSRLVDQINDIYNKLSNPEIRARELTQLKDQIDNRFPLSMNFAISLYAYPAMN